ncbi:MAG: hypothetical protein ACJ8FY_16425 [Gemmataceae bacterium]
MNTNPSTVGPVNLDDPVLREADVAAVWQQFFSGRPLDPEVVDRVQARAARLTGDIQQARGFVDDETFQSLLDDEA